MGDLPAGTVTFLFTDIEGSTRLWQDRPDEMRTALEEHDGIVRGAIETNSGYVFATGGDGFAAAFGRAEDAALAAEKAQAGLAEHPFLKARMGVHTGEAQERGGDYFGPAVNKAARVMSAGHGGQVLVSDTSQQILERDTVELGVYVLADLGEPTTIHQLGDGGFPPLRAMTSTNTNLRPQLTSFIGRQDDVDRISHLLLDHRLVTLTGVGGVGKTRLAIQAAGNVAGMFPDGAWLVELAAVGEPDEIETAVATDLNIPARPEMTLRDSVVATLAARDQLVVLDNCEHLLDPSADLVEDLLGRTPTLRVIATSREPLDVDGEHVIRLRSLATDGDGDSPAVQLFLDRADSAGAPIQTRDLENAEEICRMVDGIPLAIELAAARCRSMAPADVLERLDQRFRLLRAGRRGRVERHQTLRATVDWSYDLLEEDERRVFETLCVFVDGASLRAIEAVAADEVGDHYEIPDLIDGLVRKSMILVDTEHGSRYLLLETLRQFGMEKLADRGEVAIAEAQNRHAEYHLHWMTSIADRDWDNDDEVLAELANLRASADYLLDAGRHGDAADLVDSMWLSLGWSASAAEHSDRMIAVARLLEESDPRHHVLLAKAANNLVAIGQLAIATELANESLASAESQGFEPSAHVYYTLGQAQNFRGDHERSFEILSEGVARFEPDPTDIAVVLLYLTWGNQSPPDDSPDGPMAQAMRLAEQSGSQRVMMAALLSRGMDEHGITSRQDYETVEAGTDDANILIWALAALATVDANAGEAAAALDRFRSAIQMGLEAHNLNVLCTCSAALAVLAAQLGVGEGVAELFGTARALEQRTGGLVLNPWSDSIAEMGQALEEMGFETLSDRELSDRELRDTANRVIDAALELVG